MRKVKRIILNWLPLAVLATIICVLVYTTVQQVLRQGANDPQIQLAEDAAAQLVNGKPLILVLPVDNVDLAQSLAPFMMVFNQDGEVVASTGTLNDQNPSLPQGVLEYAQEHGEDRITWQPEPDVRIATVITHLESDQYGFVLVGRSLREVEERESQLELIVGLVWLVALAATLVTVGISQIGLSGE